MRLRITQIDARHDDIMVALQQLRARLSPQGNLVSERGREKTVEVFGQSLTPEQVVATICNDVRTQGLSAVLRYTQGLDGVTLSADTLRVPAAAMQSAHRQADPALLAAVRRIRDNILEFQRAILHHDVRVERPQGVYIQQRYLPLRRVGICVPGGAAAYPSTVLMTAVPAQAADVEQLAIVAPPTPFGADNPDVLATCYELGVTEVYRVGGAQAVAALAYGIESLPAVDKIVGPGNLFVALAKRYVYGQVDIDSIAGPSEVVVIADESTNPRFTAADLLAQAEHSPGAAILITWCPETLKSTLRELEAQVTHLSRSDLTRQSLEQFGALIVVRDAMEACAVTDAIAPEHLHVATHDAADLALRIRNAGAIFLGNYSPVAVGDYVAGPSHVLPTSGTARWAAGLTANDFLRSSSLIHYTQAGLQAVAGDLQLLADKEGLTAHRASVEVRVGPIGPDLAVGRITNPSDHLNTCMWDAQPITWNDSIMTDFVRPEIAAMHGYVPGEQPPPGKYIKLNTNENPYPPSSAVGRSIADAAERGVSRYPDPMCTAFRIRAADVLGVPPDWILCGNGSDDVLTILTRTFVGQGDLLRLPYPSYVLYRTLAEIQGAQFEQVHFAPNWDLTASFARVAPRLKLVFLANPNSPSGTMVSREQVRDLAEQLPCPLLVDEAYADFADTNCMDLVAQNPKIMVSRSLSKSYALAGLRFGFVVAQPALIAELVKVKDSYNCDTLAIAGATAAIGDQAWRTENCRRIVATRGRMEQLMRGLGFTVAPSHANFIWCTYPERPLQPVYEKLKASHVLVRYMNYPEWGEGLRISVGTDEQVDACVTLLKAILNDGAHGKN